MMTWAPGGALVMRKAPYGGTMARCGHSVRSCPGKTTSATRIPSDIQNVLTKGVVPRQMPFTYTWAPGGSVWQLTVAHPQTRSRLAAPARTIGRTFLISAPPGAESPPAFAAGHRPHRRPARCALRPSFGSFPYTSIIGKNRNDTSTTFGTQGPGMGGILGNWGQGFRTATYSTFRSDGHAAGRRPAAQVSFGAPRARPVARDGP